MARVGGHSYNFDFEGNPEKVPELHVICAIVSCPLLRGTRWKTKLIPVFNLFLADQSFFLLKQVDV